MSERTFLVSDAHYLSLLATAWLAAPEDSDEEQLIGDALTFACTRLRVSRDELIERVTQSTESV